MISHKPVQAVRENPGVLLFYVVFVVILITEAVFVKGVLYASSHWIGISWLGFWLAWAFFAIGGSVLAILTLRITKATQELRDPLLAAGYWVHRKSLWAGFLYNSVINGPLGTSIIIKKTGYRSMGLFCVLSALLFASVWVPIFTFVRI